MPGVIVTDNAEGEGGAPQCNYILHNIGCTAKTNESLLGLNNRDRCFRRNSFHAAANITIQYDVPNDRNTFAGHISKNARQFLRKAFHHHIHPLLQPAIHDVTRDESFEVKDNSIGAGIFS